MFKKLISNLPFNPGLIDQVSFYAKRLKHDAFIRRIGFMLVALTVLVQIFAVLEPPQRSLASSPDYIINGLKTKQDVLRNWDDPGSDVQAIYSRFGVTRDMIVNLSQIVHIRSTDDDLWTIGRRSLSDAAYSGRAIQQRYKDEEYPVTADPTTVYVRELRSWDILNPYNNYDAFQGTLASGAHFWILLDCGNFTQVGKPLQPTTPAPTPTPTPTPTPSPTPTPPPTPTPTLPTPTPAPTPAPTPTPLVNPGLELLKTIDNHQHFMKPGDTMSFRFEYRNPVSGSINADNVVLNDTLDLAHFDVVSPTNLPITGGVLRMPLGSVPYSNDYKTATVITVKLKANLANGQRVCNAASLTASNASTYSTEGQNLCVAVINPCTLDTNVPSATDSGCVVPVAACALTVNNLNRTTKEVTLDTTVATTNAQLTKIVSYAYDFRDGVKITNASTSLSDSVKHMYKDGKYDVAVTVTYRVGNLARDTSSITCAGNVETKPDQPLTPSKEAANITQKLTPAQTLTTKANGNDVIEYRLTTRNSFDYARANYTISDYIGDVLDYADVDTAFLKTQGGTFDAAAKTIDWAAQTVPADSSLVKVFRVTIKNPVPSTNQPGAMTTSFDCVISNKYGTETSIPINCPLVKSAEYLSTTLPNTGPGSSLMISFVLLSFVGYFLARSRLMARELDMVKTDNSVVGVGNV
jgi:hypothetical protein